ncbi:MAG: Wzz/FepE/Etk N-terminal domain-containing protein [Bacteroidota bacterium]
MSEERKIVKDDEIDLLELAKVIWSKRRFILKVTGIFVVLGLIIAFTSKDEYQASCKLMPESQEGMKGNLGGLGGLAGLAGIDLGLGVEGSLTPDLYPEIVKSVPFQLDLIHTPVYFESQDSIMSSYAYLTKYDGQSLLNFIAEYTLGLPRKIKNLLTPIKKKNTFNSDNLIELTKDEWEFLEEYKDRINLVVNNQNGVIEVTVELPDPYAAAVVTSILVENLTDQITKYKIEKAKINLDFIIERYNEAKTEYELKQNRVAQFADKNQNLTSSMIQTEYQRLQNDMNIAFEVYKGLRTQLEQAKIAVKEETPVFTILEPVRVPVEKTSPKTVLIFFLSFIIGIIASSIAALFGIKGNRI